MTATPEGPGRAGYALARLSARLAARLIDTLATLLWAAVGFVGGTLLSWLLVLAFGISDFMTGFGVIAAGAYAGFAVVAVVREPLIMARRGRTVGKRMVSAAVVRLPSSGTAKLGWGRSWARWALPHGAFVLAAVAGNAIADARGWWEHPLWLGAGTTAWVAVYGSALLDPHGRGWHDRLAGTVVVAKPRRGRDRGAPSWPIAHTTASGCDDPGAAPALRAKRSPAAALLFIVASLGAGTAGWAGVHVFGAVRGHPVPTPAPDDPAVPYVSEPPVPFVSEPVGGTPP